MNYDNISFGILLGTWIVYLLWEIVLLLKRKTWTPGDGKFVHLLSMVARERGWQMNSLVYAWAGMAGHWWWNAAWASAWTSVLFWLAIPALIAFDIVNWNKPRSTWPVWKRWARWPVLWLVVGILAGRFMFPQNGVVPWDWTF